MDIGFAERRQRVIVAAAAAVAALALYVKTLCPDIFWQDSGLYNRSVALLGNGIPPGFPGFHLFCYLFAMLPGVTPVAGMNLHSAVWGAASAFFLVLLYFELAPRGAFAAVGAVIAASLYAAAPTVWIQSVTCEVYTMNAALTAATMAALFVWRRSADARWFYAAAFLYGLACTNHPLQAILLIPYGFFIALNGRRAGLRPAHFAFAVAAWFLAMTTYLYLPVRSAAGVAMDWGKPNDLYGFYFHVTTKEFQRGMFTAPWAVVAWRLRTAGWLFVEQYGWWGVAAALAGGAWFVWRRRRDAVYFGVIVLLTVALTVNYNSFGFRGWYFAVYMLAAVAVGGVAAAVASFAGKRRSSLGWAVAAVLLGASFLPALARFNGADRSDYPYGRDYGANYMRAASYRAMFFIGEDNSGPVGCIEALTTLDYARPDVEWVDLTGNANYKDIFDFGGGSMKHVSMDYISRRYLEILAGVIGRPGRDYYFLYPYDYVLAWGYGFTEDGLLYRLIRPGARPQWRDVWPRMVTRGLEAPLPALDYWGATTVGTYALSAYNDALARGDAERADYLLALATAVGPNSSGVVHNIGVVYYARGDWGRAAPYFIRAFELDPTSPLSGYLAAECYELSGRADRARRTLREVITFNPDFKAARDTLRTGEYVAW